MTTAKDFSQGDNVNNVELFSAHLHAKRRGNLKEAAQIKRAMEENVGKAITQLRRSVGRSDKGKETRRALISWLANFDAYLRIALPENYEGRRQQPLIFLSTSLMDVEIGTVAPFMRPPEETLPGRSLHGMRTALFKARCVLAADLIYAAHRLPGEKRAARSRSKVDDEVFNDVRAYASSYDVKMSKPTIKEWRSQIQAKENGLMVYEYERLKDLLPVLRADVDPIDFLLSEIRNPTIEI